MIRKDLLIGISLTAMIAGAASAQNSSTANCGAPGANTCTINQGGNANNNSSTVTISTGSGNVVTVNQTGQVETSAITIAGNTNTVTHNQSGVLDNANTNIGGNSNSGTITQSGSRNSANVALLGNSNVSGVSQGGGANGGSSNSATVTAAGNSISSTITQSGTNTADSTGNYARADLGNSGVASSTTVAQVSSISQSERGNSATNIIRGGSVTAAGAGSGQQSSAITQRNSFYVATTSGSDPYTTGTVSPAANPATGNVASISLNGLGNSSALTQDGVQNSASVSINRGGAATSTGVGSVVDPSTGLTYQGGRSAGNSSTINQIGRNLTANVSIGGRDAAGQQGLGNIVTVNQGQVVFVPVLTLARQLAPQIVVLPVAITARGHSATVYQFGQLSRIDLIQNDNMSSSGTPNPAVTQNSSTADLSQSAFFSTMTVTQNGSNDAILSQGGGSADVGLPGADGTGGQSGNNTLTVTQNDTGDLGSTTGGSGGPFGSPPSTTSTGARNYAAASQAGRSNVGVIGQTATNASATLFQRRGSANLSASIQQGTNSGFGSPAAGGPNPVAGTGGAAGATSVTASVTQGGLRGSVQVRQDGSNLNAAVSQNGAFDYGTAGAGAGTNGILGPVVQISQVGNRNSATVTQSGGNSTATIDQRNVNGATEAFSQITITQRGGNRGSGSGVIGAGGAGANIAVARQTFAGSGTAAAASGQVGPTGDAETRLAGSISGNLIEISQTNSSVVGTGATATNAGPNQITVEQSAAGDIARLTQSGTNNTIQLLQSANNVTAIISQSGNGNSFGVTQDTANQFLRVSQTGGGNQTVTGSGANGGGTLGAPTFTPGP